MAKGKRTTAIREGVDRDKAYPLEEAVKMVKERAKAKFDETIEIAMNLGVDPRHADQMVRGVVSLPAGTGRSVRVGVFARGAKADEAKAAGADVVGAEDLVEKVQGGNIDFDRCIATPDLMPLVGRLGKVLGPRGMMPNPKVGTVTMDVAGAVQGRQGRLGRVPRREGRHRAGRRRQGLVLGRQARCEHQGVRRRGAEGQARGRQGHLHQQDRDLVDHGPGREARTWFGARLGRNLGELVSQLVLGVSESKVRVFVPSPLRGRGRRDLPAEKEWVRGVSESAPSPISRLSLHRAALSPGGERAQR